MVKTFFTLFIAIHFLSPLYLSAMELKKADILNTKGVRKPVKMPSSLSLELFKDIVTFGCLLTEEGEYEVEDLLLARSLFSHFSSYPNEIKYKFENLKTSCTQCILGKGPFSLDKYEYLMFNLEEPTRVIENLEDGNKYNRFIIIPGKRYGFGLIKRTY